MKYKGLSNSHLETYLITLGCYDLCMYITQYFDRCSFKHKLIFAYFYIFYNQNILRCVGEDSKSHLYNELFSVKNVLYCAKHFITVSELFVCFGLVILK